MVVKAQLEKLGIGFNSIELGEVQLTTPLSESNRSLLQAELHEWGLELMVDEKTMLIEKITNIIVEMIHYSEDLPKVNYSDYISEKLNYDYTYLSNVFSKVKGITIQQFIIRNKIERVKELLMDDEMNLTEISYKLNYSSVAHLSNQFKKITGFSPSCYKQIKCSRSNLEAI